MERSVVFGKITSTHGVKGAFVVDVNFENPEEYIFKDKVYYYQKLIPLKIVGRKGEKGLILSSPLIESLEKAKLMIGKNLHCKRSEIEYEEKQGEYLVADLIGLYVYKISEDKIFGKVTDVIDYSGDILLEVTSENILSNTITTDYIIFSERFVDEVNIEKNFIIIKQEEEVFHG
jgi:16S rRNA processing protein RimM